MNFDVLIIGAGPSGLSAGMVFGRLAGVSASEDAMKLKDL